MRHTFERAFLDTNGGIAVVTLNHDATINALSTGDGRKPECGAGCRWRMAAFARWS